jgi:methylamine---glutamate N-methyltransferase subunit C
MTISIPDNEENIKNCICPTCPTYKNSSLTGTLFCARGKAKEPVKSVSCPCPACPVFSKYGLKQTYYCISGKATET